MKTKIIFLILSIIFIITIGKGQPYPNITIIPTQPTIKDTIIANCLVGAGYYPCDAYWQTLTRISSFIFKAEALHCIDHFGSTCLSYDNFFLGTLPAGNYVFYYRAYPSNSWTYPCILADTILGSLSDSIYFTVSNTNGINDIENNRFIVVNPNPANDEVNLNLSTTTENINITLFDVFGKRVKDIYNGKSKETIKFSCVEFSNGIYFLTMKTAQSIQTVKVLVNH